MLLVDPDAANAETITSANWSIASATTLTATFAKNHSQPFIIRQMGATFFDTREILLNNGDVSDRPIVIAGKSGNVIATITNDPSSSTWPTAAVQMGSILTGANGGSNDLLFRNNTSSSSIKVLNAANTAVLMSLGENSGGSIMTFNNTTNASLRLWSLSDIGRIYGGGSSPGILFLANINGAGQNGTFEWQDNASDSHQYMSLTTSTGILAVGGNSKGGLQCGATTCGGSIILSGGTQTATVYSGCRPICTDTTAANAVACSVSSTTLTATGTGTDHINYFCF